MIYTYYDYLELPFGATPARIAAAFLGQLERLRYGSSSDQDMTGVIAMVHSAYKVLSDPEARRRYDATQAFEMGLVNHVVPLAELEAEGVRWADEILAMSPTAIRFLKSAFLVATDGLAGLQEFAGNATGLYYTTDEAQEGSTAFLEKREPDFSRFPRRP